MPYANLSQATSPFTRRNLLSLTGTVGALGLLSACGGVKTSGGDSGSGEFPAKDIEMTVGFAPGGSTDVMTRALTDPVGKALGVTLPVINTPGANGVLAAKELTQAEPDGYTVGTVNASTFMITPLAVSENEKVDIDELDIVMGFTQDDYVLVVHSDSDYSSIDDLKGAEGSLKYGTTGVGSGAQLCAALTFAMAEIDAEDVPFEGDAPALTAILGQQVDAASVQLAAAKEYLDTGDIRAVAVYSEEPVEEIPDVKTAREQGLDFFVSQFRTLCVPKGTDDEAKDVLRDAFMEAAQADAFVTFCEERLLQPTVYEAEEMTQMLKDAKERYTELVDEYGIDLASNA